MSDWYSPNQQAVRADESGAGRPEPEVTVRVTLGLTGPGGEAIVGGGEHGGVRIEIDVDGAPADVESLTAVDWGDGNVHQPPDTSGGFVAHVYRRPAESVAITATVAADGAGTSAPFDVIEDGDASPELFDPSEHTVAEVQEHIAANPDDAERVLAAERAGKARTSLVGAE